ncbi:MAG: tRNA guanosine(34) transglycosylase Tgt [Candidatus Omnitrophica bacterium]|nr:tRNA guanosine(34) transglycosylase Tgt [Candidatus Omnitrophota bacterium]
MYKLLKTDKNCKARRGVVSTAHGDIQSPFFMPVGTNSSVKSLTFEDVNEIGAQIVLCNAYHLFLRPGLEVFEAAKGLHNFMSWQKPTLTDSGGYQVFSLAKLRKLQDDGVEFQSHIDGAYHFFTPEKVIDIEQSIGADMIMPLDVCAPYPCSRHEAEESVRLTTSWAKRARKYFLENRRSDRSQNLFAIIQGATYKDLRERSAQELLDIGFDAYAIGGVSVGEPVKDMFEALDWTMPFLPKDKQRYFMGIGLPDQIVKAVGEGIDMFDTCLPTRFGRHGTAFTAYGRIIVRNEEFKFDFTPIDPECDCLVCRRYSKSYIRHLLKLKEITGLKLVTYHNLYFYVNLMRKIRKAIEDDQYVAFANDFLEKYGSELRV